MHNFVSREAARQLRLSPSVVTRSVADLEDRLGLVLLNRTTRSVRSTNKLVRVEPRLTVNSADAAIAAAEAGLGISSTLCDQVMASVLAGRLVPLLISFTAGELPVCAIYPARRIASTNLRAFVESARTYFRGISPGRDGGSRNQADP